MISASFCSCLGDRLLQFLRHLLTVRSERPHNSDTDFLHQISSIFKAHWSKKTFRRRLRLRLCLLLINSSLTSWPVPATDDSLVRSDFSNRYVDCSAEVDDTGTIKKTLEVEYICGSGIAFFVDHGLGVRV